jgi:hypothetical protein
MAAAGEEDGEADAIATKKQESTLPTIVVELCNFLFASSFRYGTECSWT